LGDLGIVKFTFFLNIFYLLNPKIKIVLVSRKNFWTYFKQKKTMVDYINLSSQVSEFFSIYLCVLPTVSYLFSHAIVIF